MSAVTTNSFAALFKLSLDDNEDDSSAAGTRQGGSKQKGTKPRSSSTQQQATSSKASASNNTGDAADGPSSSSGAPAADPASAKQAEAGSNAAATNGRPKRALKDPLVWIDLEMTGLDTEKDTIIEIACLVTDGELRTVIEGPSIAIHHSEEVLANMNDWCIEHHGKSGLTQRCRESTVELRDAEAAVLAFIAAHVEYQSAQLAGNSVHVDRMFLARYMPRLLEHLHYRIVDVSSLKEVLRRWNPRLARRVPRKLTAHTALSDIKESLEELRFYRKEVFHCKD